MGCRVRYLLLLTDKKFIELLNQKFRNNRRRIIIGHRMTKMPPISENNEECGHIRIRDQMVGSAPTARSYLVDKSSGVN